MQGVCPLSKHGSLIEPGNVRANAAEVCRLGLFCILGPIAWMAQQRLLFVHAEVGNTELVRGWVWLLLLALRECVRVMMARGWGVLTLGREGRGNAGEVPDLWGFALPEGSVLERWAGLGTGGCGLVTALSVVSHVLPSWVC